MVTYEDQIDVRPGLGLVHLGEDLLLKASHESAPAGENRLTL